MERESLEPRRADYSRSSEVMQGARVDEVALYSERLGFQHGRRFDRRRLGVREDRLH